MSRFPKSPLTVYGLMNTDIITLGPAPFNVKRFPEILIETFYDVSAFDGLYTADDTPWILANGDPTGYSYHADFVNLDKIGLG